MKFSASDWDLRFRQQAAWTAPVRRYLLSHLDLGDSARILEVGCGTGAITSSLRQYPNDRVFGLDINPTYLTLAKAKDSITHFIHGNAFNLPISTGAFDVVVCHFLLLWIQWPRTVLEEMTRITRPGGIIIAFAEPDYGGRIDYPPPFDQLGREQTEALRRQGADPEIGRKLSGLLHSANLRNIETGLLGGQWKSVPSAREIEIEWNTLEQDLGNQRPADEMLRLKQMNAQAWQGGSRVLFVPTFYGFGRK